MPQVLLHTPGLPEETIDEAELSELYLTGRITGDTMYWTEGMTDWEPVESHPAVTQSAPAALASALPPPDMLKPVSATYAYRYDRDPKGVTWTLYAAVSLAAVVSVLDILYNFGAHSKLENGASELEILRIGRMREFLAILQLVTWIVTGIVFLRWKYIANANSHKFRAFGMSFKPSWAVGCYFMPFANLVLPYRAMVELYQVSQNPIGWHNQKVTPLTGSWWGLLIASGLLAIASIVLARGFEPYVSLTLAVTLDVVTGPIHLLFYIITIYLVGFITRRHQKLVTTLLDDDPTKPNWRASW